jgi:NADH/NAD ratio-sensing transcriptional regulator Rex
VIMLAVRLRGAIARDRQSREIEAVYGAEGTARIGLTLERLLAGLDTLGVERATAMMVVESVALDSVPPARRRAYQILRGLHDAGKDAASTTTIAEVMELPTVTVRRVLEELVAYGLADRRPQGQGKADLWAWVDWESAAPRGDPQNDGDAQ